MPSLNKQLVLELAQGGYIRQAEPILMVGNPGLGKTHLATGLAAAACRQGHTVRFYNAAALVNELLEAEDAHLVPKFLNWALKHRVIVLDELGFIPFSTTGAHLIFQFCSALYQRAALVITTNLRFADWTQVFGDERLTAALLDRLTHKAHILEFAGAESYRFRERMQLEAHNESRRADGLLDNWQSAAGYPLIHSPCYDDCRGVVPFSIVKWFPFRLSKCKPTGRSGSLFDRQMVPFSVDKRTPTTDESSEHTIMLESQARTIFAAL